MLPRIGNALSQYIKPLATADIQPASTTTEQHGKKLPTHLKIVKKEKDESGTDSGPDFKRFKDESQEQSQKKPIKLVVTNLNEVEEEPAVSTKTAAPEAAPKALAPSGAPSVASQFLSLLKTLQNSKSEFARWMGNSAYVSSQKNQNQKGKIKKGAMLDQKVE